MDEDTLQQIEQIIGYTFSDKSLLSKAFTHSSAVDERLLSNERLEFLGDSVLAVVICQALFERFPQYLEGDLTKIKSKLVSRDTCARICGRLDLQEFLKVGKGMVSNRALSGSLAAGVLETVIAAIHLDGGLDPARDFILRSFGPLIERSDAEQVQGNFKSLLQQHSQEQFGATPSYMLLDEKGPDHNKCFELGVVINDRHFQSAWGTNKKEAEQKAALNALVELEVLERSAAEDGY
jgi:ribonuclease-3